ncbi:unnamed protein product [Ascophyllum nodosum]
MPRHRHLLELAVIAASLGAVTAFTVPPSLHSGFTRASPQTFRMITPDAPYDCKSKASGLDSVRLSRRECIASAVSAAGLAVAVERAAARDAPRAPQRARLPDGDTQGSDYMELGGGSKSFAKPRLRYTDFQTTESGLQFKDAKVGAGPPASKGDRVVINWDGYTIGYNGNIFESNKGPKGGAFDEDQTSFRFVVGKGQVIRGLEEGVVGVKAGGVRQIVVPPELGYPEGDRSHDTVGPKPSTFSGNRALDFVLSNPGYIDKTLLFNVRVVRVDKPGQRGFRGDET